mmetsp:Transcript_49580/g.116403  ORF Transcript_49580/g.116403 Transcript_49580/m.116403 type:complete len:246 (-) Transcript_49580:189-926(-)
MHRLTPHCSSSASPIMCAVECQNVCLPSGVSKSHNSSALSSSMGRHRSQMFPFTLATSTRLARPLEMPNAMSMGDVLKATPSLTAPSGSVTLMGLPSAALAAAAASFSALMRSNIAMRWSQYSGRGTAAAPALTPFCLPFLPLASAAAAPSAGFSAAGGVSAAGAGACAAGDGADAADAPDAGVGAAEAAAGDAPPSMALTVAAMSARGTSLVCWPVRRSLMLTTLRSISEAPTMTARGMPWCEA